jgi:hypothetical protein
MVALSVSVNLQGLQNFHYLAVSIVMSRGRFYVKGTVLPTIFEPSLDLSQLMLQFYAMINWTFW